MRMRIYREPLVPIPTIDLTDVKAIGRMGDFDGDDALFQNLYLTALTEIEELAHIAIFRQRIRVLIEEFDPDAFDTLPIGPLTDASTVTVTLDDDPFTDFEAIEGLHPLIHGLRHIDGIRGTRAEFRYHAGFGEAFANVPVDIRMAAADQVILTYDYQNAFGKRDELKPSAHMARVAARYRGVRL